MSDSFTEVSHQGWFSRLMGSIGGVAIGLLLMVGSGALMFWNEGRAVQTAQALTEGRGAVVSVKSDQVDPANEGKLLHVTGRADTSATLADPMFGISARALRFERQVEMYQWQEKKRTEKRKKIGGGEETITHYDYTKTWSSSVIKSSNFKRSGEHHNPTSMEVPHHVAQADSVSLGAFLLPGDLVDDIDGWSPQPVSENDRARAPPALRDRLHLEGGGFYLGRNPSDPSIGDLRIRFRAVLPQVVSLLSAQSGTGFREYPTKAGKPIQRLELGDRTADQMFSAAETENTMILWGLRFLGWLLMFIGLKMLFEPFAVMADILPFVGDLLRMGTGFFSFFLASFLSLIVIAIGWIFYRPLLGAALIVGAIAILVMGMRMASGKKAAA